MLNSKTKTFVVVNNPKNFFFLFSVRRPTNTRLAKQIDAIRVELVHEGCIIYSENIRLINVSKF